MFVDMNWIVHTEGKVKPGKQWVEPAVLSHDIGEGDVMSVGKALAMQGCDGQPFIFLSLN